MGRRRAFGANDGGAWERFEETWDGEEGGEDDDDGFIGGGL